MHTMTPQERITHLIAPITFHQAQVAYEQLEARLADKMSKATRGRTRPQAICATCEQSVGTGTGGNILEHKVNGRVCFGKGHPYLVMGYQMLKQNTVAHADAAHADAAHADAAHADAAHADAAHADAAHADTAHIVKRLNASQKEVQALRAKLEARRAVLLAELASIDAALAQ
jgi:hypothetical protein